MPKAKEKSNPKKQDKNKKGKSAEKEDRVKSTVAFVKSSWVEFKKIQWPTPRQAMGESLVVVFVVFLIVLIVMFYDWISSLLLGLILV